MNPFNRPNDSPENPLTDMASNPFPLNAEPRSMRSPMTLAENPNEIGDNSGKESNVVSGGRPQITLGKLQGDRMQYSTEGGRTYSGSMVYSTILKGNKNEVENN